MTDTSKEQYLVEKLAGRLPRRICLESVWQHVAAIDTRTVKRNKRGDEIYPNLHPEYLAARDWADLEPTYEEWVLIMEQE